MTVTIPDTLPPISASLAPDVLSRPRGDYDDGEVKAHPSRCTQPVSTPPYTFQWGDDYGPTLWFPTPPATITQEPA